MRRPARRSAVFAAALVAVLGGCLTATSGCTEPGASVSQDDVRGDAHAAARAGSSLVVPARAALADAAPLPDGFVYLADVAPGIAQEMRYATRYTFVGAPVDGYRAGRCILAAEAAHALAAVAADLARDGLGLKVYDCYRPQTAVRHFVRWTRSGGDTMQRAFYPEEARGALVARGYIASRSGHSRGATVDLTLVRLPAADSRLGPADYPDPADGPLPRCDRPRGGPDGRLDERDLDMGTAWDCFSPLSATGARGVSRAVQRNRQALVRAMARRGFRNYDREWWHFTFRPEPFADGFDFPVE